MIRLAPALAMLEYLNDEYGSALEEQSDGSWDHPSLHVLHDAMFDAFSIADSYHVPPNDNPNDDESEWHGQGRASYVRCGRHFGEACDRCKQAYAREVKPERRDERHEGNLRWEYQ